MESTLICAAAQSTGSAKPQPEQPFPYSPSVGSTQELHHGQKLWPHTELEQTEGHTPHNAYQKLSSFVSVF